jgi:hypothetical protein
VTRRNAIRSASLIAITVALALLTLWFLRDQRSADEAPGATDSASDERGSSRAPRFQVPVSQLGGAPEASATNRVAHSADGAFEANPNTPGSVKSTSPELHDDRAAAADSGSVDPRSRDGGVPPEAACSMKTSVRAQLRFVNRCPSKVGLRWLGFDCAERDYGHIERGETRTVTTFAMHVWRVLDERSGAVVLEYAAPGSTATEVTVCAETDGGARLEEVLDSGFVPTTLRQLDTGAIRCTPRPLPDFKSTRCTPEGASSETMLSVANDCVGEPVVLSWVDRACRERQYAEIAPGAIRDQHTFVGHQWRVRLARTGQLLSELVATGAPNRTWNACGGGTHRSDHFEDLMDFLWVTGGEARA